VSLGSASKIVTVSKKGVFNMSAEVFNNSSNCIANLVQNKNKFMDKLQRVLMEQ
jgi:hypothetical protein